VLDHRLNTRTVHLNPIARFIYWNMNYHLEHHMFPMVPYHALPRLHERMKTHSPAAYPSLWAAWRGDSCPPPPPGPRPRLFSCRDPCRLPPLRRFD